MGQPIQPGDLRFTTREYYLDGGDDTANDSTLSFQQLDTTLIYLSNSIANINPVVNINTGSLLLTASANLNIITFSKADGTPFTVTIDTGSGQTYTAGAGIDIVNNSISSEILTVNLQGPTNGNIPLSITATITGPSSSF